MATDKSAATVKPTKGNVRPQTPARAPGTGGSDRRQRIIKYLGEVQSELKKATWPTKQELIAQTQVVLGLLVIIGVFISAWDTILGQIFKVLLQVIGGGPVR